jgi:hypothetical protein
MDLIVVLIIVTASAVLLGRRIWRALHLPVIRPDPGAPACGAYCSDCSGHQRADCREVEKEQ